MDDYIVAMLPVSEILVECNNRDEDFIKNLAGDINTIGLQNAICVVENPSEDAKYKYSIVSGRHRYFACVEHLKWEKIPAHILKYEDTDEYKEQKIRLAELEENSLRKQLSLIELCEHIGESRDIYQELYPETAQGKAPKGRNKKSETERIEPYPLAASRLLGKSRATVGKYLCVYDNLIKTQSEQLELLQKADHPILDRVEDLSELAKRKGNIPKIVQVLLTKSPDDNRLYSFKEATALLKTQEEDEQEQKRKAKEKEEKDKAKAKELASNNNKSKDSTDTGTDKKPEPTKPQNELPEEVDRDKIPQGCPGWGMYDPIQAPCLICSYNIPCNAAKKIEPEEPDDEQQDKIAYIDHVLSIIVEHIENSLDNLGVTDPDGKEVYFEYGVSTDKRVNDDGEILIQVAVRF